MDPPEWGVHARGALPGGARALQPVVIAQTDDTARFRVDDPDELVAASFACPICLHAQSDVSVAGDDDAYEAACSCGYCDAQWTVGLTTWQVLRLRMSPAGPKGFGALGLRVRAPFDLR